MTLNAVSATFLLVYFLSLNKSCETRKNAFSLEKLLLVLRKSNFRIVQFQISSNA